MRGDRNAEACKPYNRSTLEAKAAKFANDYLSSANPCNNVCRCVHLQSLSLGKPYGSSRDRTLPVVHQVVSGHSKCTSKGQFKMHHLKGVPVTLD